MAQRAWLLVDSINQAFDTPAVTALGQELLERYRRVESRALAVSADELLAFESAAKHTAGPKI